MIEPCVLSVCCRLSSRFSPALTPRLENGPLPGRPCESLRKADLVFYGEVLAAAAPQHGDQRVTFLVVRSFKGSREGRFTGAFRVTGEGLYFVAGERRVVYASALGNGRWSTSCARSALVLRPADDEVEDLSRCSRQESGPAARTAPRARQQE
jgi:hypothetical protein